MSRLAARSDPVQAKNASPSKGSDSLVNILTESDFLISREVFIVTGGRVLNGGISPSSSSAIEAVRGLGGAVLLKSSSNIERGDMDSESKRNLVLEPSLVLLAPDAGDAVTSSGSNANLVPSSVEYAVLFFVVGVGVSWKSLSNGEVCSRSLGEKSLEKR